MAKSEFKIETLSSKQVRNELSSLRRGRGGRVSRFQPVLDAVRDAGKGQVVSVKKLDRKDVAALRGYVYRNLDSEDYSVKSAREGKDADTYTVMIGRTADFE